MDYQFGLHYILLDFDWKSFGQRFIITLIRYLTELDLKILGLRIWITGFGLENTWITNLDFDYYLWIWTRKYLNYEFGLRLLDFNWIWTWKYLDCHLGL